MEVERREILEAGNLFLAAMSLRKQEAVKVGTGRCRCQHRGAGAAQPRAIVQQLLMMGGCTSSLGA